MNYLLVIIGSILLGVLVFAPVSAQIIEPTTSIITTISSTTTIDTGTDDIRVNWLPDKQIAIEEAGITLNKDGISIDLKNGLNINALSIEVDKNRKFIFYLIFDLSNNNYEMQRAALERISSASHAELNKGLLRITLESSIIDEELELRDYAQWLIIEHLSKVTPAINGKAREIKQAIVDVKLI